MNTLADKLPQLNLNALNLVKLNRLLPPVFNIILIIACTYTLSQITWSLIPSDTLQAAPGSHNKQSTAVAAKNYSAITDAHLFGNFQQSAREVTETAAPDTRLNLVLKGVLATNPMEYGSAIISMGKNGKEDTYVPGDKVSSATLIEIYADRVILERGGKRETLRMPIDSSAKLIRSAPRTSISTASTPGVILSNIRKKILRNPASFSKYAVPVPYNKNGRKGYRLQPQGDNSLFDAVGLEPNDVILGINGVDLSNPAKGLKALRTLQRAKNINLTILRNGAEMPLQFKVP